MTELILQPRARKSSQALRKPLMASVDIYDKVQALSDDLGYRKGFVVDVLLKFALDHVVIEGVENTEIDKFRKQVRRNNES